MAKKMPVGIAGAGFLGTALAYMVAGNGYPATIFTDDKSVEEKINAGHINPRFPDFVNLQETVKATGDVKKFCTENRTILLAVSPLKIMELLERFDPFLEGDHILMHTFRYLFGYPPRGLSYHIRKKTLVKKIGLLAGPIFMDEFIKENPVTLVIASQFDYVRRELLDMLTTPYIRLYQSSDIESIEMGSAFTNIGLIFVGIAAGLGYGAGTQTALISRMVFEISRILKYVGKDEVIANGLTVMGILTAGAIRKDNLFYQMGYRMGKERDVEKAIANLKYENAGPEFLKNVYHWSKENNFDLPLTEAVYKLYFEKYDLKKVKDFLFSRPFRKEFD